jgi:hypothetical protein
MFNLAPALPSMTPPGSRWIGQSGVALALFVCLACAADEPSGRPHTFGAACTPGSDEVCQPPFSCFPTPQFTLGGWCTQVCGADSDCPSWQESGHCAGPKQSRCENGVCTPVLCK